MPLLILAFAIILFLVFQAGGFFEVEKDPKKELQKCLPKNLTQNQLDLIAEGRQKLVALAEKFKEEKNNKEYNYYRKSSTTCPNCGKKNIVEKIAHVHGKGSVSGSYQHSLFSGSGYVSGSSFVDTKPVKHCNDCGNQWKVYQADYTSTKEEITKTIIYNIGRILKGEDPYPLKLEDIEDIPAESILEEFFENYDFCYSWDRQDITFDKIKSKFKSVIKP